MTKTIVKSVILFVSIPLLNSIAFGIAALFHEPQLSTLTADQIQEYQFAMILMTSVLLISIPVLELLYYHAKLDNRRVVTIYALIMISLAILTVDQFTFRPYEHSLTFISIVSLLFTREILNRKLKSVKPKT